MPVVRVATANTQHKPVVIRQVVDREGAPIDVLLAQEVERADGILSVRALEAEGWGTWFGIDPKGGSQANPIAWRTGYRLLAKGSVKAHDKPGKPGWGPARWINWVALEHTATGARFAVINTHMIHQAWSSVPARRPLWQRHANLLTQVVGELRRTYGNVIGGGDVNRSKWAPAGTIGHWASRGTLGAGIYYDLLFTAGNVDTSTVGLIRTSSDHDALAAAFVIPAPAKPPKEEPVTTRVNLGLDTSGRSLVLDTRTLAKLRAAEARLGFKFTIVQGSYRAGAGAKASAGTHDGGGVIDLRTWNLPAGITPQRAVRVLRECGLIAWYRTKAQGFDPHIHAIDYGNPALSYSAQQQVAQWEAGLNGLASRGRDDGPRIAIPKNPPAAPEEDEVTPQDKEDIANLVVKKLFDEELGRLAGPWGKPDGAGKRKRTFRSVIGAIYNLAVPSDEK